MAKRRLEMLKSREKPAKAANGLKEERFLLV
jgi:hypothetical protein